MTWTNELGPARQQDILAAIDQAPIFVGLVRGPRLVYEYANDLYRAIVGKPVLVGKPLREALPEPAGQGFFELHEEVLRTGVPYQASELPIILERGGLLQTGYYNFLYQRVAGGPGQEDAVLITGSDVTLAMQARQGSERTAEESADYARLVEARVQAARRYERFWNVTTDYALIVDGPAGRLVDANPRWLQAIGWSLEELASRPYVDFVHPDDRDQTEFRRRELLVDGPTIISFENRYLTKDGRTLTIDWNALTEGTLTYAFGRDVTEQRHQAAAIAAQASEVKRQRDMLDLLIETSPILIAVIDTAYRYQLVNQTMLDATQRTRQEVIGSRVEDLFPAAWQNVGPAMRQVIERGEPALLPGQLVRHLRDGRLVDTYFDLNYFPMRDAQGQVIGLLAISHEVTVHVRAKQLEAEKVQLLEEADRHKDQFLGILSHELRTPINAIQGFGSILEDGLAGELTAQQVAYVGKMLLASDHMLRLVNDLLDLSRVQADKLTIETRSMALLPAVRSTLVELAATAASKDLALVNRVPSELPDVQGDEGRVRQVLANLITNAIKYTNARGTIVVEARVEGSFVRVDVVDTGIGIASEEQVRVFHSFTQLDMTDTRKVGGVGLGLSIVKALVETHGGQVGVESTPGVGSTFWFTLPLANTL